MAAKAEVHRIIGDLATRGLAIVLISSDLPEVLAMADRILVMHDGRIAAELNRSEATEELVMLAATGQDSAAAQIQVADHGPGQAPVQGSGQTPDQAITGAPQ